MELIDPLGQAVVFVQASLRHSHLGCSTLTGPTATRTASSQRRAVVTVSARVARYREITPDDVASEQRYTRWGLTPSPSFANVVFTEGLIRRARGTRPTRSSSSVARHSGISRLDLGKAKSQ